MRRTSLRIDLLQTLLAYSVFINGNSKHIYRPVLMTLCLASLTLLLLVGFSVNKSVQSVVNNVNDDVILILKTGATLESNSSLSPLEVEGVINLIYLQHEHEIMGHRVELALPARVTQQNTGRKVSTQLRGIRDFSADSYGFNLASGRMPNNGANEVVISSAFGRWMGEHGKIEEELKIAGRTWKVVGIGVFFGDQNAFEIYADSSTLHQQFNMTPSFSSVQIESRNPDIQMLFNDPSDIAKGVQFVKRSDYVKQHIDSLMEQIQYLWLFILGVVILGFSGGAMLVNRLVEKDRLDLKSILTELGFRMRNIRIAQLLEGMTIGVSGVVLSYCAFALFFYGIEMNLNLASGNFSFEIISNWGQALIILAVGALSGAVTHAH